jgi:peptidoglycan-associated lipoprotein
MKRNIVVAAVAALAVSACASNPEELGSGNAAAPIVDSGAVPGSLEDFKTTAGDTVFFAFDSFALTAEARDTLTAQAQWLQNYSDTTIRVEGNCDERGTREYNLALGERRASAARDFLVNLGVAPSRIQVVSYGKERPRDPRSNEAAWAVNRNATTVILSGAVG